MTIFPKVSATVDLCLFLSAKKSSIRVVNLLLCLMSGPLRVCWTEELSKLFCGLWNYFSHSWKQWGFYGRQSVLYMLLWMIPECVYDCCCLSNSFPVFGLFSLFFRTWVPLLRACWFVIVMSWIWSSLTLNKFFAVFLNMKGLVKGMVMWFFPLRFVTSLLANSL